MQETPASIKMLVIDIDGTLLNPEGQITARTLAAVHAAQKAGIFVTLATGRRYFNTAPIANELGLDIPLISYDGAMVIQHPSAAILHTQPLDAAVAQQAVDLFVRHHVQPVVHPNMGGIEEVWTGPAELDNPSLAAYLSAFPAQVHRMPISELCAGHPDPLRVVAFTTYEIIQDIVPEVSQLTCAWNAIKRGNYGSAEIAVMDPHCSKASGVAALAKLLNISMEQVMALGDNSNDIEMLLAVGWGVAMGQASEAVKAAANVVTVPNWEDGAAQAIERYGLCCATSAASNSRKRATCL